MLQTSDVADFKTKEISQKKALAPPVSNTGVLEFNLGVRPDYLKLSFQFSDLIQDIEIYGDKMFRRFARRTMKGQSLSGWSFSGREKGQNGYKYGRYLAFNREIRGSIFWGGASQRGWVLIEIRGALCALLREQDWVSLWRLGCRFKGRLGQIDLAADDLTGHALNVHEIDRDFVKNRARFLPVHRNQGKLPPRELIASDTGATLYIGTRESCTMFRIYEKGKQLAHTLKGMENPKWVRWEMVLRRVNKVDLSIDLIHPDKWVKALMGHSRYFKEKFDLKGVRFTSPKTDHTQEPLEVAAMALHTLDKQYGCMIGLLSSIMGPDGFLGAVSRKGTHPVLSDLNSFHKSAILEKLDAIRSGGPASGSGVNGVHESDLLEW
jgi:DNA relaxase NicK